MNTTRRAFLASMLAAAAPHALGRVETRSAPSSGESFGFPDPSRQIRGDSSVAAAIRGGQPIDIGDRVRPARHPPDGLSRSGATLRSRFRDLDRHFILEYYPWYGTNPYFHWNEADRVPPIDLASNYMPALGAYDSGAVAVLEQHAQWIVEAGVGAIDLSWWGRDSFQDRLVPLVMDVMGSHGIHVAFHLEPYADDRANRYASDILYLLREYGEKRRWDCLLLLENADGTSGPIFKSFRTIVPQTGTDCHGVTTRVPDYTADAAWRAQTDLVRETLRQAFDHVTLLADSLDFPRTKAGGFDGIAIYDNFVRPDSWSQHARSCLPNDLVFSFNVNPGFDAIVRRHVPTDSCYGPPRTEPEGDAFDWNAPGALEEARRQSEARIDECLNTTLALQVHPQMTNARRGFFATYINSFNEWHEGHQFEPMKNFADLTPEERRVGYRNAAQGDYRLALLKTRLRQVSGEPDQSPGVVAGTAAIHCSSGSDNSG